MSAVGGYSGNAVKPIALRFIAELGQKPALQGMHINAMGGVENWSDVLERDTVIFPKFDREKCIGYGRRMISCADGGHQAIRLNENRRPILDGKKCVGCHLYVLVCPERAIGPSRKRITKKA